MLRKISERPWFRWTLAVAFLVVMFSLLLLPPKPIQYEPINTANQQPQNVELPVSPDERLADYAGTLDLLTAALVAFAGLQIWLLFKTDKTAQMTAAIAQKQHELEAARYITENRPALRVRHVSLARSFGTQWAFTQGDTIFGRLIVVNAGGSKAKIESSKYKVLLSNDGMPVESPLNDTGWELITLPKTFDIGESCEFEFQDAVNISTIPSTTVFLTDFDQGNWVAYVFGQIQYADETGNSRFMGFCRQWTGKGPFIATTDPDYEYQD